MDIILEFFGTIFSFIDIYLNILILVVIVILLFCYIADRYFILLPTEIKLSEAIALSRKNPESYWQLDYLFRENGKLAFLTSGNKSNKISEIVFVNRVTGKIAFLKDARKRQTLTVRDQKFADIDYSFAVVSCKEPIIELGGNYCK